MCIRDRPPSARAAPAVAAPRVPPNAGRLVYSAVLPAGVPSPEAEARLEMRARELLRALARMAVDHELVVAGEIPSRFARELERSSERIRVVPLPGATLGEALRAGCEAARGDYLLPWPPALPCGLRDLTPYVARAGAADVILGFPARRPLLPRGARLRTAFGALLVRALFGLRLRDLDWVGLYRAELLRRLDTSEPGLTWMTEVLVRLRDGGASFEEITDAPSRSRGAAPERVWGRPGVRDLVRFWWRWRR